MRGGRGRWGEGEGERKSTPGPWVSFPRMGGSCLEYQKLGLQEAPLRPCFLESTKRKWQTSQDIRLRFVKKTHPRFGLFSERRVEEMWFKYENCSWTVMEIMTLSTALHTAGCSCRKQHETVGENHLGMWAGWATDGGRTQQSIFCVSYLENSVARHVFTCSSGGQETSDFWSLARLWNGISKSTSCDLWSTLPREGAAQVSDVSPSGTSKDSFSSPFNVSLWHINQSLNCLTWPWR